MATRKNPTLHLGPVRTHPRGAHAVAARQSTTHRAGTPGTTGAKVKTDRG